MAGSPVGATVEQVLLYLEGQNRTAGGDDTIDVNGTVVTGTLIGGPTRFFGNAFSSTYRADITDKGSGWPEEDQQVEFQIRQTPKGPEAFNVSILPLE